MLVSQRVASYLRQAQKALEKRDFVLAEGLERQANQSIKNGEDFFAVQAARAQRLYAMGLFDEVISMQILLEKENFADNLYGVEILFLIAQSFAQQGEKNKALEMLDKTIERSKAKFKYTVVAERAKIAKALLLLKDNQKKDALQLLKETKQQAQFIGNTQTVNSVDALLIQIEKSDVVEVQAYEEHGNHNDINEDLLDSTLKELNSLIGLKSAKQGIENLVSLIRIQKKRSQNGLLPVAISHHMVFVGSPGTGKTTVARLFGRLLFALGILKTEKLVEVSRAELVAGYVGQTAEQTDSVINQALDGVLFVDEAYSLTQNNDKGDFGHEAVNQLLKRMEDDRDRLAVVFAGYQEPMQKFIASNPGLHSRIGETIVFENYSASELEQIFLKMCIKSEYQLDALAKDALQKGCQNLVKRSDRDFGNARTIRNVFEDALLFQAKRLTLLQSQSRKQLETLTGTDIEKAIDVNQSPSRDKGSVLDKE